LSRLLSTSKESVAVWHEETEPFTIPKLQDALVVFRKLATASHCNPGPEPPLRHCATGVADASRSRTASTPVTDDDKVIFIWVTGMLSEGVHIGAGPCDVPIPSSQAANKSNGRKNADRERMVAMYTTCTP
jgi:hypothetical protein